VDVEKNPDRQQKLDLSVYADEVIEEFRVTLLMLADEEASDERQVQESRVPPKALTSTSSFYRHESPVFYGMFTLQSTESYGPGFSEDRSQGWRDTSSDTPRATFLSLPP
jgi:hypothetical protein